MCCLNREVKVRGELAFIGSENYSGMRIIRKEEGKQAEAFSLIIKGTLEDNWFKKSSKDLSSIQIDEEELLKVLKGENLDKKEKVQEEVQYLFTF